MSLISYKRSQGSIILRVKVLNSSVTTGAGLTGLAFGSAGLIVGTIADNEATSTAYTQAGGLIETIAALGTYAAPTATKCRFKEVDATNHPGVYEIQLADARFAVSNAKSLLVSVLGATNCAETDAVIPLTDVDPYTNKLGTPVALDGGSATIAGMLTKMADDNGGADFNAGTDSLEKIQTSVAAGFPQNVNADVEPAGGIITTGTNTANDSDSTWANDGTYWQVAATTAVGGFGLNIHQVFTLGLTLKPSILRVNAKETLSGVVHVWLYDYDAAAWEQVSDNFTAISGNADNDFTYIINGRHQQASDGEVQVRYTSTSEETNKYLYLDLVVIQAVAISELTAAEIAQAVWEADLAVVHGAFPESAGHILQDTFAVVTTVATGDTTTSFTLTAGQAANDCYNGMVITIEDATDSHYESRRIVAYTSGRVVTVDRAFSFTPAAGDHAEIVNIAYADVNVTHLAASAIQQASGYIKVSSGTGTGQLSLASGVIASNMNQILGTTVTETSGGYLSAAFKKFFDKATPTGTINSLADAVPGAAGGGFIAGTNAATSITTALTANIIGDITGTLATVTTCTTTTTNSDMVGTNGANTTVPDAAGVVATALGDGSVILAGTYDAAKTAAQAGDLMLADVTKIHGSALTETSGGYLAAAFVKLFDVATPVLVASTVMRGTDSAALATTALTNVTWTDAKAAFLDASIAAIPTTAMRGTDSAALAATALSTAVWTGTKAGYIDVAISSRGTGTALDAAGVRTAVGLASANLDTQIGAIPTTAMRGTDSAALATTALTNVTWTDEKAGFIDASIAAIPTTAMRGTDSAALAATALSTVVWTNTKAGYLDASIAAIPTTAMRGTDSAALAATALTNVTWTDAKAGYLDASIAAIPTTAMRGTDSANTTTPPTAIAIADAVLARDVSNAEPVAEEHTLRFVILEMTEANTVDNDGFLTVYQTDGATEVAQKTITDDATAAPVTGVS